MIRKRVWLGLFLLIVVSLPGVFAGDCNAPDKMDRWNFQNIWGRTDLISFGDGCGITDLGRKRFNILEVKITNTDVKNMVDTSTKFKEYLDSLTTDSTSYGCSYSSLNWMVDQGGGEGIILGAYAYVNNAYSLNAILQAGCWDDGGGKKDTHGSMAIYVQRIPDSLIEQGVTFGKIDFISGSGTYYYFGSSKYCNNDGTTFDTAQTRTISLQPGLYYVAYAVNMDNDNVNDNQDCNYLRSGILPSTSISSWTTTNYYRSGSDIYFTAAPMSAEQLKTYMKPSYFDVNPSFCIAAGYDYLNSTERKLPEYRYNLNNLCCGNTADEQAGTPVYNGDYVCVENHWKPFLTSSIYAIDAYCAGTLKSYPDITLTNLPSFTFTATDGADGCCGDDMPQDYGYINPAKNFMCYDVDRDRSDPYFNWTNANIDKYYIKTIPSASGKETDVISNSKEWYVCNATGTSTIAGVSISKGGTFSGVSPNSNEYSCADMLSVLFGKEFNDDCPGTTRQLCCSRENGKIIYKSDVRNCAGKCYGENQGDSLKTNQIEAKTSTIPPIDSQAEGPVDKEKCVLNPESCLTGSFVTYNQLLTCAGQPNNFGNTLCNDTTHYCVNGWKLPTKLPSGESESSPDNLCCFGANAKCVPKPIGGIDSDQDCADVGGKMYSPVAYSCTYSTEFSSGSEIKHCCLGNLSYNYAFMKSFSVSNTSFICFKEDGNNIISQCCFDSKCRNSGYSLIPGAADINLFNRRVLTKGSSIHTLENFDWINRTSGANSVIADYAGRYIVNSGKIYSPYAYYFESTSNLNLSTFSYLEFDLLTDSPTMSLRIQDRNLGPLEQYAIGKGNISRKWSHIIIPLTHSRLIGLTDISSIEFYDTNSYSTTLVGEPVPRTVIFDNVILTAVGEKLNYNTQNYYCTGGFEGWISDLDAPASATTFEKKGPYMFACDGLATFGWTGTQCCGDDTKLDNYGEFFNDTEAGCFNGTKITNNKRVSDVRRIYESGRLENDGLKSFPYADLLYYNNSFIGCQVPDGKYVGLKNSTSAVVPSEVSMLTASNNIGSQCAVVGDYYCMNGVWRKYILTNTNTDPGLAFPDGNPNGNVTLKFAPSGPDLIKVGFEESENLPPQPTPPIIPAKSWSCNGIDKSADNVCSGNGDCVDEDVCECDNTDTFRYTDKFCKEGIDIWKCGAYTNLDSNACGGISKGICKKPSSGSIGTCECILPNGGANCQDLVPKCYGLYNYQAGVCSNHGACVGENDCNCYHGFTGSKCETLLYCDGIPATNYEEVCYGRGECVDDGYGYGKCDCGGGYCGTFCESEGSSCGSSGSSGGSGSSGETTDQAV